jgi:signal transduction histidine kinase
MVASGWSEAAESDGALPPELMVVLAGQAWLPLLVRRSFPLPVLLLTTVIECSHLVAIPALVGADAVTASDMHPVPVATMVAVWSFALRAPSLIGWPVGLAAAAAFVVVGVAAPPHAVGADLLAMNMVVVGTAAGALASRRREIREQRQRDREQLTARAVTEERLRIARELHDVLAHNVTLVNAQASVAEYLIETHPRVAAQALRDITQHTRRAVDELRATVGLLRSVDVAVEDDDPADELQPVPGLGELDALVDGFRKAGTPVHLRIEGEPRPVDQHVDLAAFRIIQESLTNATKHAVGHPVSLELDWSASRLHVRVANPLGSRRAAAPGTGHGLIGMRERASAAGGDLQAGIGPGDTFVVRVRLPLSSRPRPDAQESAPR